MLFRAPSALFWYTFQLTPASLRLSGMIFQLNFNSGWMRGSVTSGPPFRPSGSLVALIQYSRLGVVPPSSEQW